MLGSMLVDYLSRKGDLNITATVKSKSMAESLQNQFSNVEWTVFDANIPDISKALDVINGNQWVINAIGIIKPLIHDNNDFEVERAIRINSLLPHLLASKAQENNSKILQIATDCVYSGKKGQYVESDVHDAYDVYGKTKSLGEVHAPNIFHLRCSIIGPEPKEYKSLLEWLLRQPENAQINGYVNHHWNGLTTLHFAKICYGVISNNISLSHLQHIIPFGESTKYDLLKALSLYYHREDITIKPFEADISINRTLSTFNNNLNNEIWQSAGYNQIPSMVKMIKELASYEYRFCIPKSWQTF